MPTRNVNLTDHFDRFVENQVASGKYANASEVFRAGLRLLERQSRTEEEKLSLLRSLAADGFRTLDDGKGITIESESSLRETIARIGMDVAKARESRNVIKKSVSVHFLEDLDELRQLDEMTRRTSPISGGFVTHAINRVNNSGPEFLDSEALEK